MMRIFVAGATGVIGRILLPKLVGEGYEVIGMTHNENRVSQIESAGAKAVVADIFNGDAVKRAVEAAKPDVVIHQLTALSEWNLSDNAKIREIGTRNLVDAALSAGVSFMIAQSISWAYEPGDSPAIESDHMDINASMPRKTTIDSVIALEQIVSEMPKHVILRYGMLYGPGTWYAKGGIMAEKVRQKQVPATEGVTSFLHVEDAANAAILALNWSTGVVNIVDDEPASGKEWLPNYASLIGAPAPDFQLDRKGWERGASNFKARNEYGWEPLFPSWRSGFIENMVYTALLRGINVGGNNKVDMKILKQAFEQVGMKNVVTYINSGNIVFTTTDYSKHDLPQLLEEVIRNTFGLQIKVLVLSLEDMHKVMSVLPESWTNDAAMKSDVLFLWEDINDESVLDKLTFNPEFETVKYAPGAILWSLDKINMTKSGMGKLIGTKLYKQMTVRNVNTTRKIYDLMLVAEQQR